jgi:hypothetical protein
MPCCSGKPPESPGRAEGAPKEEAPASAKERDLQQRIAQLELELELQRGNVAVLQRPQDGPPEPRVTESISGESGVDHSGALGPLAPAEVLLQPVRGGNPGAGGRSTAADLADVRMEVGDSQTVPPPSPNVVVSSPPSIPVTSSAQLRSIDSSGPLTPLQGEQILSTEDTAKVVQALSDSRTFGASIGRRRPAAEMLSVSINCAGTGAVEDHVDLYAGSLTSDNPRLELQRQGALAPAKAVEPAHDATLAVNSAVVNAASVEQTDSLQHSRANGQVEQGKQQSRFRPDVTSDRQEVERMLAEVEVESCRLRDEALVSEIHPLQSAGELAPARAR